jgi:hypothetical protein
VNAPADPKRLTTAASVAADVAEGGALSEQLDRPLAPVAATMSAPGYGRFVAAVLCGCGALLAAVLALNIVVDPFAAAGTGLVTPAVETDRWVKLDLIEHLRRSPEIVILGSSRARQAEPKFVEALTGHTAFNAAVGGGSAADAWVMTRYVGDRFPHAKQRYIWYVDAGIATNGINPQLEEDPRARRYLAGKDVHFTLADIGTYLGTQATFASFRVFRACVLDTCKTSIRYLPDGGIAAPTLHYLPEHARSLKASIDRLISAVLSAPKRQVRVDPARYEFFEKALAFMNAHGARPVIVINPIHPRVLAALRRRGFPRWKASLRYLRALHRRFHFVVVNCQDIRRWGGSAEDWSNATHVNRRNMRRMLRYVVAHSHALR